MINANQARAIAEKEWRENNSLINSAEKAIVAASEHGRTSVKIFVAGVPAEFVRNTASQLNELGYYTVRNDGYLNIYW